MLKPFILNDETVQNSHGFYLKNDGANFERFNANPVMLDNHNTNKLCGRWDNLRINGAQLLADPIFDTDSPIGAERSGQVERGFLKGASLGIIINEALYVGEQLHVTKWEIIEASVTPTPSNGSALSLHIHGGDGAPLKDKDVKMHLGEIVKLSVENQPELNNNNKTNEMELTNQTLTALGLTGTPDNAAIEKAVTQLSAERDKYRTELDKRDADEIEAFVNLAIADGKITADKKEATLKLAKVDLAAAKELLNSMPTKVSLAGHITKLGTGDERKNWTYAEWHKKDLPGLKQLKVEDPTAYKAIKRNTNN